MAFNRKTFQTRALTAIIFAGVMLIGLLWNKWSFLILFSIIHFGCWWEYLKLAEKIYNTEINKANKYFVCIWGYILMLAIGAINYSYDFVITFFGTSVSFKWVLVIFMMACLYIFFFQNKRIFKNVKWFLFIGLFYISVSWGLMLCLRRSFGIAEISITYHHSPEWHAIVVPCIIVFSIWICDTMAYIVGSLIGKTPLSQISPKKTWEGTLGGIFLAFIVIGFIASRFDFDTKQVIIISGIAAIAGTFGDLLESKLKRMAGVKDSGSIMPGHGGFLDRFDSLLLATPAVWLYVYLIKGILYFLAS
jgi:phosphatidate cytidylyltransferase